MSQRLRNILDALVGTALAVLLSAMVLVLVWQVVSRYLLGAPSTLSEELLRFGVIWLSLLGAAYATGRGAHMAIDLLRDFAPARVGRALGVLVPISLIVFSALVLVFGGMRGVTISQGQTSPVLQIPMAAIYASLPVSGVLIALYSLLNLRDMARAKPL